LAGADALSPVRHAWYQLYRLLEIVSSSYPEIAESMYLIMSVGSSCVCMDYYTENSHVVSDQTSEEATKNDKSFGPENCFVR
jgi:hypothetical protein